MSQGGVFGGQGLFKQVKLWEGSYSISNLGSAIYLPQSVEIHLLEQSVGLVLKGSWNVTGQSTGNTKISVGIGAESVVLIASLYTSSRGGQLQGENTIVGFVTTVQYFNSSTHVSGNIKTFSFGSTAVQVTPYAADQTAARLHVHPCPQDIFTGTITYTLYSIEL